MPPRPSTRRNPLTPDAFATLDPALRTTATSHTHGSASPSAESVTLHSHLVGSARRSPSARDSRDRLGEFARQVVESEHHPILGSHPHDAHDGDDGVGVEGDDDDLFRADDGLGLEAAVLAAEEAMGLDTDGVGRRGRGMMDSNMIDRAQQEEDELALDESLMMPPDEEDGLDRPEPAATPAGAAGGAGKRKRGVNGTEGSPDNRDRSRIKKDNHKEVERRRRENINDGIAVIGRLLPGSNDKLGKGQVLKLAAEFLAEAGAKISDAEAKYARLEKDKQQLEEEQSFLKTQLNEEHNRTISLETSWREAEDRAASSGFELERVKKELEDAKMRLLEKRR